MRENKQKRERMKGKETGGVGKRGREVRVRGSREEKERGKEERARN